jgi:vancomycin resistance protein YoaR
MARRRRTSARVVRRAALGIGVLFAGAVLVLSLVAGPPSELPPGTTVAGIDVGGLEPAEARQLLETRSAELERRPLGLLAGARSFGVTPSQLGARPDWDAALREAARADDGIAPIRALRRGWTRLFGVDVQPSVRVYPSVLRFRLDEIAGAVDRPAADARLERRGLDVAVTPARPGLRLDRAAAAAAIRAALGTLERTGPISLPIVRDEPTVTAKELARAAQSARTALSAPATVVVGPTRFRLPRWRIAQLLDLPNGTTRVGIGGQRAERWLASLARTVGRAPRDATFRVVAGGIEVVPSRPGRTLDVAVARTAIAGAVFSPTNRIATLDPSTSQPERSTADAKAMGITGIVGSYTTTYGGTPGRLHNVALVAELIDGALVAPGARFSFNETTGERSEANGFEEAPVIINGELQNGIGGGVCQVSTTVFNAAFEAGLSIEQRTNHALYISHYPTGRDATVNYPDIDLVFRNDTDKWLLVRTFVGPGSLTVNLYGTPQGRRVETETAPLEVDGKIPWKRIDDPTMFKGEKVVEQLGAPPRTTSVTRRVYAPDGTLMYDTTWSSYYVGEPTVVRLGKKPRPKSPAKPPATTEKPAAKAGDKAGDAEATETTPPVLPRP